MGPGSWGVQEHAGAWPKRPTKNKPHSSLPRLKTQDPRPKTQDIWDVRCQHCGSLEVEHRVHQGQEKNYCRKCGRYGEWIPTLEEIRQRAAWLRRQELRRGSGAPLSQELIQQVLQLVAVGENSREIARRLKISRSAVHKIRQGRLLPQQGLVDRCPACQQPVRGTCLACGNRSRLWIPPRREPLLEHWKPLRPFWCMAVLPPKLAHHMEQGGYYHMDVAASLAEVASQMPAQMDHRGREIILRVAAELLEHLHDEQPQAN